MIHLVAEVRDCDAEVYVNDVPIYRLREFESAAVSLPVHPMVIKGVNELKMVINPGPVPARSLQAGTGAPIKPNAQARARLMVVPLGTIPEVQQGGLVEVRFAPAQPQGNGPVTFVARGTLPLNVGTRLWERGAVIAELTPQLENSALAFVNQVREALQLGQARKLAPALKLRITDVCTSYGLDPTSELQSFVLDWERFAAAPGWLLAPIENANASLRLCASGRFVECIGKDWKPLIKTADMSAGGLMLRLGIAPTANGWAIVC